MHFICIFFMIDMITMSVFDHKKLLNDDDDMDLNATYHCLYCKWRLLVMNHMVYNHYWRLQVKLQHNLSQDLIVMQTPQRQSQLLWKGQVRSYQWIHSKWHEPKVEWDCYFVTLRRRQYWHIGVKYSDHGYVHEVPMHR